MAHVKKAEKSRVHAKQRRTDEATEISEIAGLLPLPSHVTQRLDKASILRLAITFLRLKHYVGQEKGVTDMIKSEIGEGNLLLESLNGFFIIVSVEEEIIYVSENVESHMGLNQVDMLGKNVYDFVYEKDNSVLKSQFEDKYKGTNIHGMGLDSSGEPVEMNLRYSTIIDSIPSLEQHRQFFLRMKCSYQKRVSTPRSQSSLNSTQNDFLLLQWTGYVQYNVEGKLAFLAAVVRPLQPTPIMELKMDGNMFISRHSLDLTFMYCDPRLSTMLGYEPNEIPGSSMYQYHHPGDLEMCGNCHNNLMTAGTSISKYYRFLNKNNEWCWLQTRATIVYNTSKHPQYIVCMNYVVSEREGRRYLIEHLGETLGGETQSDSSISMNSMRSQFQPPVAHVSPQSQPPVHHASPQSQPPVTPFHSQLPASDVNPQFQPPVGHASSVSQSHNIQLFPDHLQQMPASHVSPHSHPGHLDSHSQHPTRNISPQSLPDRFGPQSQLPAYNVGPQSLPDHFSSHSSNVSPQPVSDHYSQHSQLPAHHVEAPRNAAAVSNLMSNMSDVHLSENAGVDLRYHQGNASPEQIHQYPQQGFHQEGSPRHVPQHPSPPSVYGGEPSPTFYLPHQTKSEKSSPPQTCHEDPGLGSLWLSVHTMVDPSNQFEPEVVPSSLAEDMEEISFAHCQKLMNKATAEAINSYSNIDYHPVAEENSGPDWTHCERLVNKEAINMFNKIQLGMQRDLIMRTASRTSASSQYQDMYDQSSMDSTDSRTISRSGSAISYEEQQGNVSLQTTDSSGFVTALPPSQFHDQQAFFEAPQISRVSQQQYIAQEPHMLQTQGYAMNPDNMQPAGFEEFADVDDMLQSYPEINTASRTTNQPELMLPPAPVATSSLYMNSHHHLISSYPSTTSDGRTENVSDSTQSLMSLSSNLSRDSLHTVSSLASEMDYTPPSNGSCLHNALL